MDFNSFYSFLSNCAKWLSIFIEFFGVLGIIIPNTRKIIVKFFHKLSGYNELDKRLNECQSQILLLTKKLEEHTSLDELKMNGLMNGLKDSLLSSFHFYEERGYVTLEELKVLQDIYEAYIKLGGNGLIKYRWENVICKLPSKPPKN